MNTDLSSYNNDWFDEGGGVVKRSFWFVVNVLFFINPLNPFSGLKVRLLKWFGASIGTGVVIKPGVNIKYPWKLVIGDYTWIGEKVWIDNLDRVTIGCNCCLSQDAMLLCGNHNYRLSTFDLIVSPIVIEDGVWIGARSIVTGGVVCQSHSLLATASVASRNMEAWTIYRGNPCVAIRKREMK